MNDVDARGIEVYGGFHGEFRKVHKADWEKVSSGGVVRVFDTKLEAEVAAWRALRAHFCGIIRRDGEVMGSKSLKSEREREKIFGSAIFKRGRKISEEHMNIERRINRHIDGACISNGRYADGGPIHQLRQFSAQNIQARTAKNIRRGLADI